MDIQQIKHLALDLWRLAPLALLCGGCYFLSLFMDNLWRYTDELFWLAPEGLDKHSFAVRLFQFSAMTMRALYCVIIAGLATWLLRRFADNGWAFSGIVLGALAWWILAVAETFSVAEYILCKMVNDSYTLEALNRLWEAEGQTSSCERWGGTFAAWLLPIITTAALVWVSWRAYQVWRRTHPRLTPG